MANVVSIIMRLVGAVAACSLVGFAMVKLAKSEQGKFAIIASFWFLILVVASGILG